MISDCHFMINGYVINLDPASGCWHHVEVGCIAGVSGHTASVVSAEVRSVV
jgi:hypothetical protein